MSRNIYLINCVQCGHPTSRAHSRAHAGLCKSCLTGTQARDICPDCGQHTLTAYQARHHYHCDACTREADPVGHLNEVMGYNDYQD